MQGSKIILLTALFALSAVCELPINGIDYELSTFEDKIKPNCGTLHLKATNYYRKKLMNLDTYKGFGDIFGEEEGTICRAKAFGERIWVSLSDAKKEIRCKIYIPLITLNLFQDLDDSRQIDELLMQNNQKYVIDCKQDNLYDYEDFGKSFSEMQKKYLALSYSNFVLTETEVPKINLSEDDEEVLQDNLKEGKLNETFEDLKGLSEEGIEKLINYTLNQINPNSAQELLKIPDMEVEFDKFKQKHENETNSNDDVTPSDESNEERVNKVVEEVAGTKKYLNLGQIGDSADFCDQSDKEYVVSLFNAKASLGDMKTVTVYTQNIEECIKGHDDKQFKVILAFGERRCLLNLRVDRINNKIESIRSPDIDLIECEEFLSPDKQY